MYNIYSVCYIHVYIALLPAKILVIYIHIHPYVPYTPLLLYPHPYLYPFSYNLTPISSPLLPIYPFIYLYRYMEMDAQLYDKIAKEDVEKTHARATEREIASNKWNNIITLAAKKGTPLPKQINLLRLEQ